MGNDTRSENYVNPAPLIIVSLMKDLSSIFTPANRSRLLVAAAFMACAIAVLDWATKPYVSLGFLYLFPVIIVGGYLSRAKIVGVALLCAVLQELFSNLPESEAVVRLIFSSAGLVGTGLLVSELLLNRRMILQHVEELRKESRLREDAEQQLQMLVESSPAAILTVDNKGKILLANEAAQQLLSPDKGPLRDDLIIGYLPSLQAVLDGNPSRSFRTTLQCKGLRSTGEAFLAGVWFSTYGTLTGMRLAAVIVDLSEELRDREDLSLDHLLKNSRILVGAIAHEVRNLCSAALVIHKNLSRLVELSTNEDFRALKGLIENLEIISARGIESHPTVAAAPVDLSSVLDELRVLIESVYIESHIVIDWQIPSLPLVSADRYGLIQVFLNLARNSRRAMESSAIRKLIVQPAVEGETVVVRIRDTGCGVSAPDSLFRPFQPGAQSSGLGLYISRATMRHFGGELRYEPQPQGACFAVVVPILLSSDEGSYA